ncbi:RNA methyltransferase [Nanoarchaeota archaeon NZ13-N]|nr:MAG: RNA methyltransferase [Nanoarchaeota archaeon NZ13-N]
MQISIVFVEPESEDNIGALARVMANFGFRDLILINPKVNPYSEKVKIVAREEGWKIIRNLRIYDDLDRVISMFDVTYGTTGVSSKVGNEVLRNPLTPRELASRIWNFNGRIGIFFGRESTGFSNQELDKFDAQITIPASEDYPIMNVTHAASIILYEIFIARENPIRRTFKLINNHERYVLKRKLKEFVYSLPTHEYRKPVIYRALRNLIGKAFITKREFSILMGVLNLAKNDRRKLSNIKK